MCCGVLLCVNYLRGGAASVDASTDKKLRLLLLLSWFLWVLVGVGGTGFTPSWSRRVISHRPSTGRALSPSPCPVDETTSPGPGPSP